MKGWLLRFQLRVFGGPHWWLQDQGPVTQQQGCPVGLGPTAPGVRDRRAEVNRAGPPRAVRMQDPSPPASPAHAEPAAATLEEARGR